MIKTIMDLIVLVAAFALIMNGISGGTLSSVFMIAVGVIMLLELVTDVLFHSH